ncbi:MAG: putative flavoprotein (TIGR03862 family) [Verrucomicrobiales bacterium]|jgi:uncharacterized flavoprotein (TIGR03862 family)
MRVVVVGAGPGGLMAAEVLATAGHEVAVYDQRRSPARKFVLAGRGGLNITHNEPLDEFLRRYGPDQDRLEPAIRSFPPNELRAWCAGLGHDTFEGSSGRVFPEEFRAVPLLRSWLRRLESLGVSFHLENRWTGWADRGALQFETPEGFTEVGYDKAILALGGASWPKVGSDGSWQHILRDRGVEIKHLRPANCGVHVTWSDVMVERFAGEPVKNAAVMVGSSIVRGDPIITKTGLEGGPIYAHSRRIRDLLGGGPDRDVARLRIDLFPDLDVAVLEARLASKRKSRDTVSNWLRRSGVTAVGASLMREATSNTLPRDPAEIAALAKAVPLDVVAMADIDRAISTAGGVSWSAIDENFELREVPDVYAIGEMLDWEAPTGGYLLQAVFSTGRHVAAGIA